MSDIGPPREPFRARRDTFRLRGKPPTEPMPLADILRRTPYRGALSGAAGAEESRVRAALDFALRLGELMLRCGAGAPHVETGAIAVCAAAGVDTVEVDITGQSLLLHARIQGGRTVTVLRVVRSSRYDYGRLVAIHRLVDAFVENDLTLESAIEQLQEIKHGPRIWSEAAVTVGTAILAGSVAIMVGATPLTAGVTIAVVLIVSGIAHALKLRHLPEFYGNAVSAFAATVLAWIAYAAGALDWLPLTASSFAFIVAGGIVALLPGRALASTVEDVLSGYSVTGAGRMLGVMLSLVGVIIGVTLGLQAALQLTSAFDLDIVSPAVLELRVSQSGLPAVLLGSAVLGASGAVTLQSPRQLIPVVAVLSVGASVIHALLTRVGEVGAVTSTGIAAVALGCVGRFVALRMGAPSLVVVVPASFALLPGLTIFRGLYEIVGQGSMDELSIDSGAVTLLQAAGVLLAIATGTTLGEIIASPWDTRLTRARRRQRI